nr:MAG TPA: BNR/Asp-box repeat protein [Caudoviricetes sp.]
MSLNKARKRLIRKCRKLYNSRPIGLKFSTDGGKTFVALGNIVEDYIPDARNINSGNINASKLAVGEFGFRNFEITINQAFSKEEINRLKGVLW